MTPEEASRGLRVWWLVYRESMNVYVIDFALYISKNLPIDKPTKNQVLSIFSAVEIGDCFTQIKAMRENFYMQYNTRN